MANPTRRPSPNSNPVDAPTRRLPSGWLRIAPILVLVVLTLMTLWSPRSEARLDPYYLLRGLSTGSVKPRILFVLDTSGSMTWRTDNSNNCPSGSCENTASAGRSRINAAREGIRTVISNVGDTANFGLMTFGQNTPPKYNSQVPGTCGSICTNQVYYCRDSGSWGSCGSTKSCPVPWTGGGWSSSLSCPSTGQSCDGCDTWSTCTASSPVRFDIESQMDFESTNRYYEICGTNRSRNLVLARQIAMYLCRELTDMSLPKIGQEFGGRDHTTVMHADRKIRKLMAEKHAVYNQVTELTARIKQQARRP